MAAKEEKKSFTRVFLEKTILDQASKYAPDLVLFNMCRDAPMDAHMDAHKTMESLASDVKDYIDDLRKNKYEAEISFILVDSDGGHTSWFTLGKGPHVELLFYNLSSDQFEIIKKFVSTF